MTQVKIIKDYKMLKIGDTPNVDELYAAALIKRGIAEKPKAEKK
jgi:hypothetical protein